jgi:hypothetical protein
MGRGRAKAKQTKVARQLKYSTGDLDVTKLSVELGAMPEPETSETEDPYAEYSREDEDQSGRA